MEAKISSKKLMLLQIFVCFFSVLQGQITFNLVSKRSMSVTNNYGCSMRVAVFDDQKKKVFNKILSSGKRDYFSYKYSNSTISFFEYIEEYDSKVLDMDKDRIKSIQNQRNNRRKNEALLKIFLTFLDQVMFEGKFSTTLETIEYVDMFLNGATKEEWVKAFLNTAVEYTIDQSFDKKDEKTIALGAFELIKVIPREDKDLRIYLGGLVKLRLAGYSEKGKIIDTAKLPSRFFNFSIEGAYPINQKFLENSSQKEIKPISIGSEKVDNTFPFGVRLNYYPNKRSRLFFEYGKTDIFKNTNSDNAQYLKINNAFRFSMYSLGVAPSLSIFEIGLGVSYLQQENFFIDTISKELQTTRTTDKWAFFLEPIINISIGKYISVFGSWKGNYFGDKEIDKTSFLLHSFKVGININFIRKGLDFSN